MKVFLLRCPIGSPQRQTQFLLGRALLNHALTVEAPRANMSALRTSISHCGVHVCVAINDAGPVGVDVLTRGRLPDVVISRFFSERERAWLRGLSRAERARSACSLWALKEAICKARGTGLRFPLPEIDVPLRTRGRGHGLEWLLFPQDDAAVAVAWQGHGDTTSAPEVEALELRRSLH